MSPLSPDFFFRAVADMRRRDFLPPPPALRPPLTRAQRARAAAAILARVAADIVRRLRCLPPSPVFAPALVVVRPPPTKPANRRSRASIWRRKETACSNCLSDKSIDYPLYPVT